MIKPTVTCILLVVFFTCAESHLGGQQGQNVVTFQSKQGEAWCELCVLVMDRIEVLIQEKDSEGKVNATLYGLCDMVQGAMRKQCYAMVPLIKRQITQGFDSKKACLMIQFCGAGNGPDLVMNVFKMNAKTSEKMEAISQLLKVLEPHAQEAMGQFSFFKAQSGFSVTCMVCKMGVELLDKSLEQYKKPLINYVIGICNDLPSPTNKACSDAMGFYIPTWWDEFFTNIASPDELCYKLNLCQEPAVSTSPRTVAI